MIKYPNQYNPMYLNNYDDRFIAFPFLTGALVGGAAVGLTRPRPIYNVAPYPPYPPYMPYGNYYYPINYRPY